MSVRRGVRRATRAVGEVGADAVGGFVEGADDALQVSATVKAAARAIRETVSDTAARIGLGTPDPPNPHPDLTMRLADYTATDPTNGEIIYYDHLFTLYTDDLADYQLKLHDLQCRLKKIKIELGEKYGFDASTCSWAGSPPKPIEGRITKKKKRAGVKRDEAAEHAVEAQADDRTAGAAMGAYVTPSGGGAGRPRRRRSGGGRFGGAVPAGGWAIDKKDEAARERVAEEADKATAERLDEEADKLDKRADALYEKGDELNTEIQGVLAKIDETNTQIFRAGWYRRQAAKAAASAAPSSTP